MDEKLAALAEVVGLAANLPPQVARGYATNFAYWADLRRVFSARVAHEKVAEEMSIPILRADARVKIDAAYTLLFT